MDDLISRQGTMDEISKQQTYKMFEGEDTVYLDANDVGSVIASMPSIQPEVLACGEGEFNVPGTNVGDMISRQAAIDTMCDACSDWCDEGVCKKVSAIQKLPSAEPERPPEIHDILNYLDTVLHPIISPEHWDVYSELHDMISSLPSAQPEPLTDKEQRIFLAAMGREEKVCKQVDDECRDYAEPYEVSLVSVCKAITRKVKGALWT